MITILMTLTGCAPQATERPQTTLCNGEELCDRPLDQVAFARTHNSHATQERGYSPLATNHVPAVPTQLQDGVRSFNVDVYPSTDDPGMLWVCHGYCELGHQDFTEILGEFAMFLEAEPNEVLLLDFQNEAPPDLVAADVDQVLGPWLYSHAKGSAWPTLGQLIDLDQRMVISSSSATSDPWFHLTADVYWGTPWGHSTADSLDCELATQPFDHGLFELEHTLTAPLASPDLAAQVNDYDFLLARVRRCEQELGATPNAITVDYYTQGDPLGVVQALNAPI